MVFDEQSTDKVSITQFYGIEINDFAGTVAKTALWIAESQMMKGTERIIVQQLDFLPLTSNANIVEANALRIDWNEVVPAEKLDYIMGIRLLWVECICTPLKKWRYVQFLTA
ncbi:MAG: hypothetical protein FRC54_05955 [bacterium LCO1.1]|uniref:MmeI-like DNA-methyltransferase domain-containing protein n=1 Tax=Candidatus Weimeria bifida TaxID=2599074 RepID=A0A6N7J0U5_9FIRM|nr:hypothetical protein [Candidatus Weimeria bifida]